MTFMNIAMSYQDETCLARAKKLAVELSLPLVSLESAEAELLLVQTPERLELRATEKNAPGAVAVDFLSGKLAYRARQKTQAELIKKALGIKSKESLTVLDAMAGLGSDGFIMATMGCEVIMIERSNIVAALLKDGLERAKNSEQFSELKLSLQCIDARDYLSHLKVRPDIIYLDPMFPDRKKTAKVKKSMQILQRLLPKDNSGEELLAFSLMKARKRVIVKRPRLAPFLGDRQPDWQIIGKNTRFDVYAISA